VCVGGWVLNLGRKEGRKEGRDYLPG
jgi:hypothetical protein